MDDCIVLFAATSYWLDPASYWAILKVALGLGAVIFVHELGHFLFAKMCGVKCDKFYVGFDVPIKLFGQTIIPAKLVHWTWGETEYGIGSIPLGGYVKMMGQDDNPGNIEEQVKESMIEGETTESAMLPSGLVDKTKIHPRSYLAKSVVQRMMIISAGVIFNLIFAVFFAMFAFKAGVDYEPAMIGNVTGSGPAWQFDLAGAEVKRINEKEVKDYFPYMNMAEEIIFGGTEGPIELEYIPYGETKTTTITINGEVGLSRQVSDLPLIGVTPRQLPTVGELGTIERAPAAKANPPFKKGDKIVEINGTPINTDIDLRHILARDADLVAEFTLERETENGSERIETKVEPQPNHVLGFGVQWLPISVIKHNSPADKAGIKVGDEVVAVNGQPRGDFLTLDNQMMIAARAGETVELTIKRDGKEEPIILTPDVPRTLSNVGPNRAYGVDTLGFAIPMNTTIGFIEPGGAADVAGLKVGDDLISVEYLLTDAQKKDPTYKALKKKPIVKFEKDKTNWAEIFSLCQNMDLGTEFKFTYQRGDLQQTAKMKLQASNEYFQNLRGIYLSTYQKNYKSETWKDAFKYGALQVKKDMKRVLSTLAKLIRGKISPTNLGGPGTIAMVATSEASESTSRLLLFLTFLSANLAIVNFLPIPILDGGHMLFLAYEGIFRKPVSERVQLILMWTGLIMILSLMLFVISLDVFRISSLFG